MFEFLDGLPLAASVKDSDTSIKRVTETEKANHFDR